MNPATLTPQTIETVLAAQEFEPVEIPRIIRTFSRRETRDAAVLIPLIHKEDGWHVLFIRRTEMEGDMHSGQVALPGGGSEESDDDAIETALRESWEELGIHPEDVQVLGQLGQRVAISNRRVTPVVGILSWPCELVRQESEVARWFTIPLAWLADPSNRTIKERKLPLGAGRFEVIHFDKYDGELLWGLTAQIIMDFLGLMGLNNQ